VSKEELKSMADQLDCLTRPPGVKGDSINSICKQATEGTTALPSSTETSIQPSGKLNKHVIRPPPGAEAVDKNAAAKVTDQISNAVEHPSDQAVKSLRRAQLMAIKTQLNQPVSSILIHETHLRTEYTKPCVHCQNINHCGKSCFEKYPQRRVEFHERMLQLAKEKKIMDDAVKRYEQETAVIATEVGNSDGTSGVKASALMHHVMQQKVGMDEPTSMSAKLDDSELLRQSIRQLVGMPLDGRNVLNYTQCAEAHKEFRQRQMQQMAKRKITLTNRATSHSTAPLRAMLQGPADARGERSSLWIGLLCDSGANGVQFAVGTDLANRMVSMGLVRHTVPSEYRVATETAGGASCISDFFYEVEVEIPVTSQPHRSYVIQGMVAVIPGMPSAGKYQMLMSAGTMLEAGLSIREGLVYMDANVVSKQEEMRHNNNEIQQPMLLQQGADKGMYMEPSRLINKRTLAFESQALEIIRELEKM
jgi:hypothetical protein